MDEDMLQFGESDIQELVGRIQQGETDLFGRIFDMFADRIFRFAYLRIGDREEAKDVTSEVFLGAYQSLPRYRFQAKAKFSTWLFSIARRVVANHYRQGDKRRKDLGLEGIAAVVSDDSASDLDKVGTKLEYEGVIKHLKGLPPDIREALTLRFIEELDYPEIEEITGKKQNHIRVLVHRGLKQLKEKLNG